MECLTQLPADECLTKRQQRREVNTDERHSPLPTSNPSPSPPTCRHRPYPHLVALMPSTAAFDKVLIGSSTFSRESRRSVNSESEDVCVKVAKEKRTELIEETEVMEVWKIIFSNAEWQGDNSEDELSSLLPHRFKGKRIFI